MKTFIINIASRTDRWEQVTAECGRVGISDYTRIDAVTGDNRPLAFNQSQHKALQEGVASGEPFMVLEDDCAFTTPFWPEPPEDFDLFHLGTNIIGMDTTVWQMPTRVSKDWFRLYNSWMTQSVVYTPQMAQWILDHFNPNVMDTDNCIYDEWLRRNVYPHFNCYVAAPMITYQRPSKSDIWNVEADYTGCFRQGNEYLNSH